MKKNNKITLLIMLMAAASFLVQSCGKDNKVSYPTSILKGAILYNGQPVGLVATSADLTTTLADGTQNPLFLTQTGPNKYSGGIVKVFAKNDGTFTINTFDGDYTLSSTPNKNPFPDPGPVKFTLKGEATVNLNVTPFFWVSNYKTEFVDSVFKATFKLEKLLNTYVNPTGVTTAVNLENIKVFFHTTTLPDAYSKIFERTFTTSSGVNVININGDCSITINLKGTGMSVAEKQALKATTGLLWANIGVKTVGIVDAIYQKPVFLK